MGRRVSRAALALMMGLFLVRVCGGQADAPKTKFEVVSIKPFNPDLSQGGMARMTRNTKGRWEARNVRLKELLMAAFRLNENQIVGGPKWLDSASWDIDATHTGGNQGQFPLMLQAMLEDRFRLVFHRETRALSVYLLEVTKNGPKLKESTATSGGMSAGQRVIKYSRATMRDLADQLSSYFDRQVLDRTDLKGHYEIDLSFAPVNANPSVEAAQAESLPSIFSALEEQLGLKLRSGNGPVEVLVIDRAEKPSEN
jgi:uncharacterized protein (TIGR03435 family)